MRFLIDIYPGDHALEDVPAEFTVEEIPADPSVGECAGRWATLESVQIGGLELPREQVQQMIGVMTVHRIERDVSEGLSSSVVSPGLRYA